MDSTALLHAPHKRISVLCPLGHELPTIRVRLNDSAEVECATCGAIVELSPYWRDGAMRVGWSIVRMPRKGKR